MTRCRANRVDNFEKNSKLQKRKRIDYKYKESNMVHILFGHLSEISEQEKSVTCAETFSG